MTNSLSLKVRFQCGYLWRTVFLGCLTEVKFLESLSFSRSCINLTMSGAASWIWWSVSGQYHETSFYALFWEFPCNWRLKSIKCACVTCARGKFCGFIKQAFFAPAVRLLHCHFKTFPCVCIDVTSLHILPNLFGNRRLAPELTNTLTLPLCESRAAMCSAVSPDKSIINL